MSDQQQNQEQDQDLDQEQSTNNNNPGFNFLADDLKETRLESFYADKYLKECLIRVLGTERGNDPETIRIIFEPESFAEEGAGYEWIEAAGKAAEEIVAEMTDAQRNALAVEMLAATHEKWDKLRARGILIENEESLEQLRQKKEVQNRNGEHLEIEKKEKEKNEDEPENDDT